MSVKLKSVGDQVIVITGASSGIGLATAKMAAERGARLVLASRNINELDQITSEINSQAGVRRAIAVQADVADPDAVQSIADEAVRAFGGFDTWVNNAGVTIYGKLAETPLAEKRRLFDVNFWGVVYGCRSAVPVLRKQGGALINIGSVLSDRAIPIQGVYAASKHAVKAYTDSLRMELEAEGAPISVTLVKPASIDTPYTEHAVSRLEEPPKHIAPVYAPEVVAKAILESAETPQRDVYVGGSSKVFTFLETFVPRLADMLMEKTMMESGQQSAKVDASRSEPALFKPPLKEGRVRGNYPGRVMKSSAYTSMSLNPGAAALIATGLGAAAAAGISYLQSRRTSPENIITGATQGISEAGVH